MVNILMPEWSFTQISLNLYSSSFKADWNHFPSDFMDVTDITQHFVRTLTIKMYLMLISQIGVEMNTQHHTAKS